MRETFPWRRLGQFTDLAADEADEVAEDVAVQAERVGAHDRLSQIREDLRSVLDGWDSLSESERATRLAALSADDSALIIAAIAEETPAEELPEAHDEPVIADGEAELADAGDDRWHAIIVVEGVTTTDGREIEMGSLSVRPLPLPLQWTTKTTWGHEGADHGGSIETLTRDPQLAQALADAGFLSLADGALLLVGEGGYDQTDDGQALRGMVNRQELRFVSVDLEYQEAEEVINLDTGECHLRVTRGNVMGATVCPFPAFPQCIIAPISMSLLDAATQGMTTAPTDVEPVIAEPTPVAIAASAGPQVPPASWFRNPQFGANDIEDIRLVEDVDYPGRFYCPNTVTSDGRVFGHAAAWHREHIGYMGRRIVPPHSIADYAYFATGTVIVSDDTGASDVLRCGVVTMDTGHADTRGAMAGAAAAKRHYDDTGTQIARVEIGEDEHGIWYAGSICTEATEADISKFRAVGVSGDWRPIGGNSEMVGLLAVNTQGFPQPRPRRSYAIQNNEETELALVAAGFVPARDPMHDAIHREVAAQVAARLAPFQSALDALAPLALAQLTARVRAQ